MFVQARLKCVSCVLGVRNTNSGKIRRELLNIIVSREEQFQRTTRHRSGTMHCFRPKEVYQ